MLEFTNEQLEVMATESSPRGLKATQELSRRGISLIQEEAVGELGVALKEPSAATETALEPVEVEPEVKPKATQTQTRKKRSAKPKVIADKEA